MHLFFLFYVLIYLFIAFLHFRFPRKQLYIHDLTNTVYFSLTDYGRELLRFVFSLLNN